MNILHTDGSSHVGLLTEDMEIQALLALFQAVATELHWHPGTYLSSYPKGALHFAVCEETGLVGGLQVVLPDAAGCLPYQVVWPEVKLTTTSLMAHVTILALAPAFRGHPGLFWPLCVELWRYSVSQQIEGIVLETTPPMLRLYRRIGWPLEVVGELREHWGELCYLCRMDTIDFAGSLLMKATRSVKYRALVTQAYRSDQACICSHSLP